jgi:hypothetical protein
MIGLIDDPHGKMACVVFALNSPCQGEVQNAAE